MITQKQAKALRKFRWYSAAVEVATSAGADIETIAEHKRKLDKAEKAIRDEFQALVDAITENRMLQAKIDWLETEVRRLETELKESKKK